MTIQTKRLFVLFILTACALAGALGVTRLAQARSVDLLPHEEPSAPAGLDVLTLTLSSSRPGAFFDPGPQSENRTVYFNNQGAGQVVSVTAAISSSQPISTFQGAPAFGITPTMVLTTPWLVSYTIGVSDGLQPAVAFTGGATGGLSASHLITFTPDLTEPAGLITAPAYSNISFTLHFTSSDGGSGVAQTAPWFRPPATTTWRPAGPGATSLSGALSFSPTHGEGAYWFSTIVTDQVGNQWSGLTLTDAVETLFDITPPAGTITGPAGVSHSQIALHWWATDTLSGPAETQLWVRPPNTTTWSAGGAPQPGLSGTVTYTAATPGRHYFAAIATDRAGNQEMTPTLSGEMATLYDPNPPVITGLLTSSSHPAQFYDPADGTVYFTGSQTVTITVIWTDTNPASLRAGPAFGFTPTLVGAPPWAVSYTIPVSPPLQTTVPLTVSDGGGLTDTARLVFTRDISPPAAVLTAPLFAATPVSITFEGSDPGGSGSAELHLWATELPTATWGATGLVTTAVTGTFLYTPAVEGVYAWGAVVTDHVGNVSPTPTLTNVQTIYDLTAPDSQASAPPLATSIPISVHFVSTDTLSGVDTTELWSRPPNTTTWAATGLTQTGVSGDFVYSPPAGDGLYQFAARATDRAGNAENAPTVAEAALVLDRRPPTCTVSSPLYSTSGDISVTWEVTDTTSGIVSLTLWVSRPPTHTWEPTNLTSTQSSGVFPFALDTEGLYYFDAIAGDTAGNEEPIPSGEGDSATWFDTLPPAVTSTGILEDSDYLYADGDTLYYGDDMSVVEGFVVTGIASDTVSGLDRAIFSTAFGGTPAPDQTPETWNGAYSVSNQDWGDGWIEVQVYDKASLSASAVFTYLRDTVPPTSTLLHLPSATTSAQITLPWQSADARSGVAQTELWTRLGDGDWEGAGILQPGASGIFSYTFPAEGWRYFAAVAADRVGNQPAPPTGEGDGRALYDRTPPDSAATSIGETNAAPITVSWTVTDSLSGVAWTELWARVGAAGWTATGMTSAELSGTFAFAPTLEDVYYFATVAQDQLDNSELPPTGAGDTAIIYDITGPTAAITVPAASAAPSFVIQWSAVDPGNGVGLAPAGAFQVEYRAEGADWTPWLTATSQLSATFGPTLPIPVAYDTSYAFRVHARDALDNPGDPVSATVTVEKVRIYLPVVLSQFKAFSNGGFESGWIRFGTTCGQMIPLIPRIHTILMDCRVDINGIPVDVIPADGPIYEKPEDYCTEPSANSGWQRWQINIPHIFWGENIILRIANYNRPDKWLNTWTYIDDIALVNAP